MLISILNFNLQTKKSNQIQDIFIIFSVSNANNKNKAIKNSFAINSQIKNKDEAYYNERISINNLVLSYSHFYYLNMFELLFLSYYR